MRPKALCMALICLLYTVFCCINTTAFAAPQHARRDAQTSDFSTYLRQGRYSAQAEDKPDMQHEPGAGEATAPIDDAPVAAEDLPYAIYVSKKSYTIAILTADDAGQYTKVLFTFPTALGSGSKTRPGEYTVTRREAWHKWSDRAYSPFATRHSGGLWFHAPLYGGKSFGRFYAYSYNEIGTACTAGCLRTTTGAASWIYYNCPTGTPVTIANDDLYQSEAAPAIVKGKNADPTHGDMEVFTTGFSLNCERQRMLAGQEITIGVEDVTPQDATTAAYTYTSDNPAVATVTKQGVVSARQSGQATITVTADDPLSVSRQCVVVVATTRRPPGRIHPPPARASQGASPAARAQARVQTGTPPFARATGRLGRMR